MGRDVVYEKFLEIWGGVEVRGRAGENVLVSCEGGNRKEAGKKGVPG